MRLSAIALAIALSIVSAARCAAAAEGENGGGTPPGGDRIDAEKLEAVRREAIAKSGIQPREDEEVSLLAYRAVTDRLRESRVEQAQAVLALDRERVVAALAHEILDMERGNDIVNFVAIHLRDERLVPFLAARIRLSQDGSLASILRRIQLAPSEFLRGLMPVLIEHALDSDYGGINQPGRHPMFYSTLVVTTDLLDKITEGKTGIKPVSYIEILVGPGSEAKKVELRAAWRKWWEENKAEWKAKPKPEEVPEEGSAKPKPEGAPEEGARQARDSGSPSEEKPADTPAK